MSAHWYLATDEVEDVIMGEVDMDDLEEILPSIDGGWDADTCDQDEIAEDLLCRFDGLVTDDEFYAAEDRWLARLLLEG